MTGNRLDGNVPTGWGASFHRLEILDLSRNLLYGDVPAGLALMPNLRELWLNHNQVFGTTPAALTARRCDAADATQRQRPLATPFGVGDDGKADEQCIAVLVR